MRLSISKLEKNKYIRSIIIVSVVLGSLITIGSFVENTHQYFYDNVFIAKNITNQVKNLSAGQDIEYFKKYLGPQILQREVSEKFTEYIFNYKNSFIQALVNREDSEVVYWAITYCGNSPVIIERPVFSMAGEYAGKDIHGEDIVKNRLSLNLLLNEYSFTDFFKNERGDLKIFISGATANSYAYESVYMGNGSAYQTIIVGVNDICASSQDLYDHLDVDTTYLESGKKPTEEAINDFREKIKINTYAETSPFIGENIIDLLDQPGDPEKPYLNFGVDRIRVRYFSNY